MAMQAEGSSQIGPLDKYLRPKARHAPPCMPQTAFRSTNLCQQLLAAQLGWRMPPSLDAWRQVQARTALLQLQLPPVWSSPASGQQRQEDRLVSCCWAAGELPELATAGPQGVKIRRFVEGRHHEYPLRLKGGGALAKPGRVTYLDRGAAYTLAAAHAGGVVLWDCRAASRTVAELATASSTQLLQAMPGGTVLLTAAADGQLALYDVRRLSSTASSVINFGGSRASQQLIASFNVPARADEAAAAATGSSSSSVAQPVPDALLGGSSSSRIYPFFRDVTLNPADPNLVAYVRPDLQVGLFDLYHNRVLQQVAVTEGLGSPEPASAAASASPVLAGSQRQAAARGCWDAMGRVLYTHGLLRHCQPSSGAAQLQATVAAVDFGSWAGRQQRRECSWQEQASHSSSSEQAGGTQQPDAGFVQSSSMLAAGGPGASVWAVAGGGLVARGGQVLHLPMAAHAAPTELAAGSDGEVFAGTLQGDVICIH
ncbi:hypothetical protein OEZ85_007403 [Tetradesmus obliquus]|uniref:Uncharacterized protein n=1 Tax=Tetradesmus obliquus TaxID=3088 RepID=A0ABY8TG16_TETOB|nr:hypothetical protein OEZ85_007403 [Tetradesmus obliquus]